MTKYYIKNKFEIDLTQKDYLTSGGEGAIYRKASTAYKIYLDPKKMLPLAKIQELSVLTNDNIIKPTDALYNSKNIPVGYSMRYVSDTHSLCSLFPKAFRERNNISPDTTLNLVRFLQNIIKHIHQNKILLVDLNELNFLVDKSFKEIFAIDVDSYQTKSFPATAIMESIRDRHSKIFNENTDWFSFAITAFQTLTSIHPYKGKHTRYKSLEERMVKNISVLNKDVSVPSVVYPFSVIPDIYLQWFKAVLEDGKRVPPPDELHAVIKLIEPIVNRIVNSSNSFDVKELKTLTDNIIDLIYINNYDVAITSKNIYMNNDVVSNPSTNIKISTTPKTNCIIAAYINFGQLILQNLSKRSNLNLSLAASEIMQYDGRIYCKNLSYIIEIQYTEIAQNILVSSKIVGTCLEQSSHLYDGVLVQNLLGSCYISLFPKSGICNQIQIKELNSYKIINAKFDNNVLIVIGAKNGKYDKLIIRFSPEYDEYDLRLIDDIDQLDINFITLTNGTCIHLVEDGKMEIFSNKKGSVNIKEIIDNIIKSNMRLYKNGTNVLFTVDNKIFSIKMK